MDGYRSDSLMFATDSTGTLRHVDEVPNGLKCGCVCAACGQPLIARNGGSIRAHHFAHESGSCEWGVEAVVSLVIEEVVLEACSIMLPEAFCYDEEAHKLKSVMPSGVLAVTGARQLEISGRSARGVEIDCASVSGVRWKVVIIPCLAHPLTAVQQHSLKENYALVITVDIKAAREAAFNDEGRHYDRDDVFALMQDPEFVRELLSEPNKSVAWAVNGFLEAEVTKQKSIRAALERKQMIKKEQKRKRVAETMRKKQVRDAEARRKRAGQEAIAKTERQRIEKEQEPRGQLEEEMQRHKKERLRRERATSEIDACEQRGHAARLLVLKGLKDVATECPLYGEANTVMHCGAYSYSPSQCPFFVRKGRDVLECSLV